MNATETTRLCKIITSLAPQQKFDDDTPAVWHAVLVDVRFSDALEAVKTLARTKPFIGTSEICSTVETIRQARVKAFDEADGVVPNIDPDQPRAYANERRAIMQAVADQTLDIQAYRLGGITLTGAPAHRAAITADPDVAGPIGMIEALAAELIPRSRPRDIERARNETEQRAHERAKQLAGLQKLIDDEAAG
jgi:hypothetical protein